MYTDVQQLKTVQMLAQPPDFSIFMYLSDAIVLLLKSTTPTRASGYNAQRFALYVLIRWLQSALIPFVTTQSVAEDGGY